MSFEGYYQLICKNGHYSTIDAMEVIYGQELSDLVCDDCGEKMIWENLVDDTNCDNVDYIDLEVKSDAEFKVCECCGAKTIIKSQVYKIPKGGNRI